MTDQMKHYSIEQSCDATEDIMQMMIDSGLAQETEVYNKHYLLWLSRGEVEKYHEIHEDSPEYDVTGFSPKGRDLFESIYNRLRGE